MSDKIPQDLPNRDDGDFEKDLDYVMEKNKKLYRRLSTMSDQKVIPAQNVRGHLINSRNDGTLVFRVYDRSVKPFTFVDYELTVDNLEIVIVQDANLIQTSEKHGHIEDFPNRKKEQQAT